MPAVFGAKQLYGQQRAPLVRIAACCVQHELVYQYTRAPNHCGYRRMSNKSARVSPHCTVPPASDDCNWARKRFHVFTVSCAASTQRYGAISLVLRPPLLLRCTIPLEQRLDSNVAAVATWSNNRMESSRVQYQNKKWQDLGQQAKNTLFSRCASLWPRK
jgi:hypothetical protein